MRLLFWLKSSFKPHSLAFSSHSHFNVNNCIEQKYVKIACNIWSDHCGVRLQELQPFLKFSFFFFSQKVPLNTTSFDLRKSLKRIPSLAYIEINQTKQRFSSMFAFVCIFWTLLHILTCK